MQKIFIVKHGNTAQKKVALTFDDGPNQYITPKILDILKSTSVRASFFLIGKWAEQNPEIIKRILENGHSIGAHSQEHSLYENGGELCVDMIRSIETLEKISRSKIRFIRFPRFRYRPLEKIELPNKNKDIDNLFKKINNGETHIIDCNINTHDWDHNITNQKMLNSIFDNISNSSIIVLHDGSEKEKELKTRPERTLKILSTIINKLKKLRYELVNLENLELKRIEKTFYEKE